MKPELVLHVPYEGAPTLAVVAEHEADERRLLGWLERSGILREITDLVERRQAA